MRILVVGAGAIGGYFGARLAEAGRDVTFLVRPKRAEQLAGGLFVLSPKGDVHIPTPKLVTEATLGQGRPRESMGQAGGSMAQPEGSMAQPGGSMGQAGGSMAQPEGSMAQAGGSMAQPEGSMAQAGGPKAQPFDLVLLSCKAFDLESAMDSFAPAMGPTSMVLPLLNGMGHIEKLQKRFGNNTVLGGQCQISATLDTEGRVVHLNDWHTLGFGELDGSRGDRMEAVNQAFAGVKMDAQLSTAILQDMWEKWIFIASMAGLTCLMRAALGDVEAAGGRNITLALFDECAAIAAKNLHVPSASVSERIRKVLTTPGSTLMASMLRDTEDHKKTEHEHLLGDLLARAHGARAPVLETCLVHMRAYEARRVREG
jgi:2-dehydropantoate 2-reductase